MGLRDEYICKCLDVVKKFLNLNGSPRNSTQIGNMRGFKTSIRFPCTNFMVVLGLFDFRIWSHSHCIHWQYSNCCTRWEVSLHFHMYPFSWGPLNNRTQRQHHQSLHFLKNARKNKSTFLFVTKEIASCSFLLVNVFYEILVLIWHSTKPFQKHGY